MKLPFCLTLLFFSKVSSQVDSTYYDFSAYLILDSIMITAQRSGFSVDEFIEIIQNDKSTQEAFQNLRKLKYKYRNDIEFFNNLRQSKAKYSSLNIQHLEDDCQWMEVINESSEGQYFKKNKSPRFYTAKLYDKVFYVSTTPCNARKIDSPTRKSRSNKLVKKRIAELKKLIYTPGKKADVPLIGYKTAIFTDDMIEKYDLSLTTSTHASGANGYLFTAKVKSSVNIADPNATVVKYLEVFVEKSTLQVLMRNYKLQYNAGIYDFDIVMKVELSEKNGKYFPIKINYNGHWNIVGKSKEDCIFNFNILEVY